MSRSARAELHLDQILVGDVRHILPTLPASSVDCVITSPPYFGLRDYGHSEQIGLEANVDGWVSELRGVCRELARLLKPTGSLWLNLGDGYSVHPREGAAAKGLLLGPQRLSLALAEDGWLLRNQVVWHKPNAMPHSVTDRLTNRHELVLFLVRQPRYFFDLDNIRIPATSPTGKTRDKLSERYPPLSAVPSGNTVSMNRGLKSTRSHPLGKNPGDVWSIATAGFRGAHFATFPISLVERPLLATCPERVCGQCGRPWIRSPVDRSETPPRLPELVPDCPDCPCNASYEPGIVLDPFMGSGTVALAAEKYGRRWVGIELNPSYAALANQRLDKWRNEIAERQPVTERPSDRSPPLDAAA